MLVSHKTSPVRFKAVKEMSRDILLAEIYQLRFLPEKKRRKNPSLNAIMAMRDIVRGLPEAFFNELSRPKVFDTATGDIVLEFKNKKGIVRWKMMHSSETLVIYSKENHMTANESVVMYPDGSINERLQTYHIKDATD